VRPTRLEDTPPSTDALTPEWLTALLCKEHPGARVLSIQLGAESSGSTNRRAFTVTYNDAGRAAGLPTHLFNKSASGFKTRLMMHQCHTIVNEYEFYRRIRPELKVEVPHIYHASMDPSSLRMALVMEDIMHTKKAEVLNSQYYVSRDRIEQMLALHASVHAQYWNSPRLDKEFTWLLTPTQWIRRVEHLIEYRKCSIAGIERSLDVMPTSLVHRGEDIYRALLAAMEVSSQRPFTYQHGDPHIGNFYITSDGRSGLLDWQVAFKGNWGHDYCYTLLSSLTIDDRRKWERELLQFYLDKLKQGGATPPSFDEAWLLYRQQTLYTFVGWLYTIGFGPLQPDMQPRRYCLPIIERSAVAIEDLESLKALGI
jgi:Phosphotransferase enzyme family